MCEKHITEYGLSGRCVYEKRTERSMSQEQLAEKTGLSRSQIYKIETGKAKKSSIDTLKKIANVFQVDMEELLCEKKEKEGE